MLSRSVFFISVLASALLVDPRFVEAHKPIFRAASQGALTQLDGEDGCVDNLGREGCADGRQLLNPVRAVVSADGRSLYVTYALSDARDRRTGSLTQVDGEDGCVDDQGREGCADGRALNGAVSVIVSRDGKSVYITSSLSGAVAVFARDRRTGTLAQVDGEDGCVDDQGREGCADGRALATPRDVAVSLDDKNVYVVSEIGGNGAVAVFARDLKRY